MWFIAVLSSNCFLNFSLMPNARVTHEQDLPESDQPHVKIQHIESGSRAEDRDTSGIDLLYYRRHIVKLCDCFVQGLVRFSGLACIKTFSCTRIRFNQLPVVQILFRYIGVAHPVPDVGLSAEAALGTLVEPVHTSVGFCFAPFKSTINLLCWIVFGLACRRVKFALPIPTSLSIFRLSVRENSEPFSSCRSSCRLRCVR